MTGLLKFWKSVSIRSKITISFFLTTLAGVLLISAYANFISNKIFLDKTVADNLGILQQFSEKLDSSLEHANSLTKLAIAHNIIQENVSSDPGRMNSAELHSSRTAINLTLARLVENSSVLSGMSVYSLLDERSYYSRGYQEFSTPDSEERQALLGRFNGTRHILWLDVSPGIYKIYDEQIDGLRLVRRLYMAHNGRLAALIESVIDEEYISSLYKNILGHGQLLIVNGKGQVVSAEDKSLLFTDLRGSTLFSQARANRNRGSVLRREDGERILMVNNYYAALDWYIIGEIPLRSIRHDIRMIAGQIIIVGFLVALLSMFFALILSRSLTNPILSLQNSIADSGSDLSVRAEILTNDEIGALAREYNEMLDKQHSMMNRLVTEQEMLRKYELSLLQAQINPHFLYNALENISGLIDLERKEDAHNLISEISRFYRGILSQGSSVITLGEELKLTEHYINILNVRYNGRIDYRQEIEEGLLAFPIVKMTLQPLIENAVYHGLKSVAPPWKIRLKGQGRRDEGMVLELRDNGRGIRDDAAGPFSGFGTSSTNERLKLYFGKESGISIENRPEGGALVRITLPPMAGEGRSRNEA